jgi:regulator of nonsense transcripts 1
LCLWVKLLTNFSTIWILIVQVLSKQPLWNHLLNDYKDQHLLMEGPLTNLRESAIQFTKPRKLVNATNPGGRYMSTTMFDAREVLVPGGAYDRRGGTNINSSVNAMPGMGTQDMGFRQGPPRRMGSLYGATADPRMYSAAMGANFPVPVDYIMSFAPPQSFGGMMMSGPTATRGGYGQQPPRRSGGVPVGGKTKPLRYGGQSQGESGGMSSLDGGVYSQGPLTQMMSQPYNVGASGAFSQQHGGGIGDLSQPDSIYLGGGAGTGGLMDEFRSQADGMLSQDSTYQGDRAGFYQSQPLSQPGFYSASQY